MSAFVVEDKVINEVISCIAYLRSYEGDSLRDDVKEQTGLDLKDADSRRQLGEAMFLLNCKAVDARYGENEHKTFRDTNYQYRNELSFSLIQAYKSLGCWLYQCNEGDVPAESLLYAAMQKIHGEMAHTIVRGLSQYDKARW